MGIDKDKVLVQLKIINDDLVKLKLIASKSLGEYILDEDIQDVSERRLQTAIESCLNIGNHIIAVLDLKIPEDYASIFEVLSLNKVISVDLAGEMSDLARFRNLLVHIYWKLDHEDLFNKLNDRIQILEAFLTEIYNYLNL